jgi:hypothetical protein
LALLSNFIFFSISSLDPWSYFYFFSYLVLILLNFIFVLDSFVNLIFLFNFSLQFKIWWYIRFDPQYFFFNLILSSIIFFFWIWFSFSWFFFHFGFICWFDLSPFLFQFCPSIQNFRLSFLFLSLNEVLILLISIFLSLKFFLFHHSTFDFLGFGPLDFSHCF